MSKIVIQRSGLFVSPGEKLGVIEEFIPKSGTYVEEGNIYSALTGRLLIDLTKRELYISPRTHQPLIPKEGDIIIGEVANVQEKTLSLKILQIGNTSLSTSFSGIMHISDVSQGYVKTMNDAFKIGDIIRARVISTKNREIHLSTQNNKLGVIQAVCTNCGGLLIYQNNHLKCERCNKIDKRKISVDYVDNSI